MTAWLGNSAPVAMKHYLQVRDTDFERATQGAVEAAQNQAQQPTEDDRNASQTGPDAKEETPVLQGVSTDCETLQDGGYPRDDSNIRPAD